MATSLNNPAWLEWMTTLVGGSSPAELTREGVSRRNYAATLPPGLFYCLLDELPLHLIPRRVFQVVAAVQTTGKPVPESRLHRVHWRAIAGRAGFRQGTARRIRDAGTMAWVRSAATGNLLPFGWVRSFRPWCEVCVPMDQCLVSAAGRAGPVGGGRYSDSDDRPSGVGPHTDLQHTESIAHAASLFREKGYAPLGDIIHPFHLAALRRYYRHRIRTGAIKLGDGQSPLRYVAHNEPVARFFHHDIAATLSAVAGESLKPSYVYMASYLSGARLKKHTDREQCEFSVTLCLDFSPEPAVETPWPIRLDTPTETVTVYQALGDGLAYRGTRLPHYRDALGDGQTSTSIFFHYVAADFSGSLD